MCLSRAEPQRTNVCCVGSGLFLSLKIRGNCQLRMQCKQLDSPSHFNEYMFFFRLRSREHAEDRRRDPVPWMWLPHPLQEAHPPEYDHINLFLLIISVAVWCFIGVCLFAFASQDHNCLCYWYVTYLVDDQWTGFPNYHLVQKTLTMQLLLEKQAKFCI